MEFNEWLNTQIGKDIWEKKYRYNNESLDEWFERVSGGDEELKQLIKEKKFLFGGRALTNRGTDNSGSMFNCYSSGFAPDDYTELLELNKNLGLTYKAQGGQGVSMSKLRPKGTVIGTRFKSDGIIPFMEIFNTTTKETSQGGSRKGALMISLDIRHKEAGTFIKIKSEQGKIEKANLSLEIDDEFMQAVDTYYKTGEEITLHEKRDYSGHIIEYDIIPINFYKLLVQNCYDWADPACLFTERFRNYNLMEFDDDYQIETCNPCGEQPLPPNFCCNLGSLNMAEFVKKPFTKDAYFDNTDFIKAIHIAIKALDDIIDENANNHPLPAQKDNSLNYRNVGLGVFGYASALMKMGIKYGSEKAKKITDKIFYNLFVEAVKVSVNLAKEKGAFPKYKPCVFDSKIIKKHFDQDEINEFKTIGIRNCSLISIAPTGTISTMFGETGGCEPEYALKYIRKTESLDDGKEKYFDIYCKTAQEYLDITGEKTLPDYFIGSADIPWKDRVDIQAIMQDHVDTAISSTVNLPQKTTKEEIEQLFLYAWEKGLKGITIFRDGCKKLGILTTGNTDTEENKPIELPWGTVLESSDDLIGKKRKINSGCGSLHVQAWYDPFDGRLLEVFLSKGGTGGCASYMVGLSRTLSLALRTGAPFDYVIDQLKSVPACPSYVGRTLTYKDTSKGSNCPNAIGYALAEMQKEVFDDLGIDDEMQDEIKGKKNTCPECGELAIYEGGCISCKLCGWSRCN